MPGNEKYRKEKAGELMQGSLLSFYLVFWQGHELIVVPRYFLSMEETLSCILYFIPGEAVYQMGSEPNI